LSAVFALEETGEAAYELHHTDTRARSRSSVSRRRRSRDHEPELRSLVGEERLTIFRHTISPVVTSQLTEIDHVAIAVHDIDAAIACTRRSSAVVVHREVVESDGCAEASSKSPSPTFSC